MSSFQSQNNDIESVDNNYRSSLNSAPVEKNRNFFNNDNLPPELFDILNIIESKKSFFTNTD